MSRVRELFTFPIDCNDVKWNDVIREQHCRYSGKRCFKVRKSPPNESIGTCSVQYGKDGKNVIICPHRLLERKQIFADCVCLLNLHQSGNELHLVPEVPIPGGNVDYILVLTDANRKVKDFVGIELQSLDTSSGAVWPERELALQELGLIENVDVSGKSFSINWKMTAKTILLQLHHKIKTFEEIKKHLVLVVQDCFLDYMEKKFAFGCVNKESSIDDSLHFHSYKLMKIDNGYKLRLDKCYSTDSEGVSKLLDMNANANIGLEVFAKKIEEKISDATIFTNA